MRTIYSKENKLYKICIELASGRGRKKHGLYLLEGEKLLRELERSGGRAEAMILNERAAEEGLIDVSAFGAEENEGAACYLMSEELFKKAAAAESPQGLIALVKIPSPLERENFLKRCGGRGIIALDRLQDAGNVGTILRTAEAAGYGGAVLVKGCADVYAPKTVRAAAGATLRLPLYFAENAKELRALADMGGRDIVATAAEAEKDFRDRSYENSIVAIGNEGNGVSEELLSLADDAVKIPMRAGVESLNASISAALIMYENLRG